MNQSPSIALKAGKDLSRSHRTHSFPRCDAYTNTEHISFFNTYTFSITSTSLIIFSSYLFYSHVFLQAFVSTWQSLTFQSTFTLSATKSLASSKTTRKPGDNVTHIRQCLALEWGFSHSILLYGYSRHGPVYESPNNNFSRLRESNRCCPHYANKFLRQQHLQHDQWPSTDSTELIWFHILQWW